LHTCQNTLLLSSCEHLKAESEKEEEEEEEDEK